MKNKVSLPSKMLPHIEALTQNMLGMIIAFIILYLWGMSVSDSILLQAVFFVTSYIRSFLVRGVFRKLELEQGSKVEKQ